MQNNNWLKILIPWILVTTLGMMFAVVVGPTVGETLGFFLGDMAEKTAQGIWEALPSGYVSSMVAGFVNGLVAGAVVGFFQWLVLRQWIRKAAWWIFLTTLGNAIGGFLSSALFNYIISSLGGTALAFLLGLILTSPISALFITVPQWIVLTATRLEKTFWWIPASLLGWITGDVAFAAGLFAVMLITIPNILVEAILGVGSGFLTGVITGFALVFILGRSSPETPAHGDAWQEV